MTEIKFIPFPELATDHLCLRELNMLDENEIFTLRSDDMVNKFLDRQKADSIEDARQFIKNIKNGIEKSELILWAISLKNQEKLIGTICIWKISKESSTAEIGYELLPGFEGKGFMHEAVSLIIEYGFKNMKLHTFFAGVSHGNLKSIKLLEKNNFIRTQDVHDNSNNDENQDTLIYSLSNND